MSVLNVKKIRLSCTVNGKKISVRTYPMKRLLDVIREDIGLTGTKEGCGEGECGACSVMLNGQLVMSCLVPAISAEQAKIRTIEGVASKRTLHAVQQAFLDCGGAQCGICTPGMVMAALNLIQNRKTRPSLGDIQEGLAGNLCRCTGYTRIFNSVVKAFSDQKREEK